MRVPTGNQTKLRFAFATRALTQAEREAYEPEGGKLPAAIGYDPPSVAWSGVYNGATVASPSVVKDAVGEYHVIVTAKTGSINWRGLGKDSEGNTIVSTKPVVLFGY